MRTHPHIEISTLCNLSCPGCWTKRSSVTPKRNMTLDELISIINKIKICSSVSLHNGGEPTMNPELIEMVGWLAAERGMDAIRIVSNGLARPLRYYKELFNAGLTHLEISVDSLDKETILKTRRGTDPDELLRRIRILADLHSNLRARTTVSRINQEEIESLLLRLERVGIKQVSLQPLESWEQNKSVMSIDDRFFFLKQMQAIEGRINIKLDYKLFMPAVGGCSIPFISPNITIEGHMTPCCNIPFKEDCDYGSLIHNSFEEVWNSNTAIAFRAASRQSFPAICSNCTIKKQRDIHNLTSQQANTQLQCESKELFIP